MNKRDNPQAILSTLALTCLLIGIGFYLLMRPTSIRMYQWLDMAGMGTVLQELRHIVRPIMSSAPDWMIYSLPFSLGIAAYIFAIYAIWQNAKSIQKYIWLLIIPVVAILAELAQLTSLASGHFDIVDLVAIVIATASSIGVSSFIIQSSGGIQYE